MARWFVMDRRVASELRRIISLFAVGETEQAFSLTISRLLPMFLLIIIKR